MQERDSNIVLGSKRPAALPGAQGGLKGQPAAAALPDEPEPHEKYASRAI